MGDVYILGLGLDFSESDLWWLIEFKSNYEQICGRTVFYNPQEERKNTCVIDSKKECTEIQNYFDGKQCKDFLLDVYHVQMEDLNMTANDNAEYRVFYSKAVDSIEKRI